MPNLGPGDKARNQLLKLELRRQTAVVSEFKKIEVRLMSEIADLLERIEKERRIDGNASPGTLFRKARALELLDQVEAEINAASDRLAALTTSAQSQAIDVAQVQAGQYPQLQSNLTFFDAEATRELVGIAGDGQPLAEHFAALGSVARQSMFDALFAGIATGTPNQAIAREIQDAIGGTSARAMTIVRTETNRAYREATRKFYIDTPAVIGWRWVAALDLNTCPICWALHGQIFKTKTKFGTHPNCRCTLVPVFADDVKVETGPQRFAKLNDTQKRTIIGPRRLDLYNQGAELKDFVELNKSPFGIGRQMKPIARTTFKLKPREPNPIARVDRITRKPALRGPATPKPALPAAKTLAIKPGDPVPIFAGPADAAEYMRTRFPATVFDYSGFDVELLNSNVPELVRLLDKYPETAARLEYVGTYVVKSKVPRLSRGTFRGAYAHAAQDGSFMAYNPQWFGNAEKLRAAKKRNFEIGWSATDKEYSTTTHEFGHLIEGWVRSRPSGFSQFDFSFADGRHELSSIAERVRVELKPKYGELSDYALKGRGSRQHREQFAEGFSQWNNRPPESWAKYSRAQKLLIERAQKKLYGTAEQRDFRNLSEAEKEKARKEFEDFIRELGLKVKN